MFFWKKDKSKNFDKLSKSERVELGRTLLDEGNRSLEKGKNDAALESFRQLVRLEPQDPDHRRRLADCHGKLGNRKAELEARAKAATLYAEAGFLLKGIAMCKLVLAIDPSHQGTQQQLASLNELTGRAPLPAPAQAPGRHTQDEEEARKDRAVAEARARVEKVRAAREEAAAAKKALAEKKAAEALASLKVPSEVALAALSLEETPPPSLSLSRGAPLASAQLESIIAPPPPGDSKQSLLTTEEVDDDEIFIAPLDEDLLDEDLLEVDDLAAPVPSSNPDGLVSALKRVPLLSELSQESFITLIEQVSFLTLNKGEVLFEVGAPAHAMYCIVEGEVAARLPGPFGKDFELGRLGEGEFFGEIGLLADQPRQATIAATSDTQLLVFERNLVSDLGKTEPDFIKILLRFVRERLVASLIATNPLFAPFTGSEAIDLTRRFRFLEVKARKSLVRQGHPSGGVFILLTGGARVIHSEGGAVTELGELGPGDIFGEMSLINRQDAVASVVTSAKSYVLELPADDFTRLVMMHPALLSYVSSLALTRQATNDALLLGHADMAADSLSLV